MKVIERICVHCILIGSMLFIVAFGAAAAAESHQDAMPWRDLATGAIGLVVAIVGAFAKGQQSKVDRIDSELRSLRETVITHHPNREGLREAIAAGNAVVDLRLCSLETTVRAVHRRLDHLHVPQHHTGHTGGESDR